MTKKATAKTLKADETKIKKAPSKQPAAPETKEAVKTAPAEEKAETLTPEIIVQYQGGEVVMSALVEAAKEDFHKAKKRTSITSLSLYVKPEEHTAYYVVNGDYEGKIPY